VKSTIEASEKIAMARRKTSPVRWAQVSLSLSILLSSLGTSIANVGLPTLAHAFNATFQQVQWVVLAYLLAITTLIVSVGRLGDVIGRRRLMLVGICLFTVASGLCGIAQSLWLLIASRVVQGLGAAIMMVLTMAMVGEAVPKEKTGSAMGLLGAMSAVGTALGPTLGGLLIALFGWPALFLINLPLGILTYVLAHRYLPKDNQVAKGTQVKFDVMGTLVLVMTLAAYALAMTIGRGSFGQLNITLLLLALLGIGLFVFTESRTETPLIRMSTFQNSVLSAGFAMSALVTTVVMATLVVGPFYLAGALGLDTWHVGLVMSSGPIIAALTGAPAGRLVDRLGPYRMGIAGLIGMVIGASTMALLPRGLGITGYVVPLAAITGSYALFQAANNTAVMTNIRPDQRGVIAGLLNLSRNLGLITGASVMGAVFAAGASTGNLLTASADSVESGMRFTFAVAAGLILLALAIAFLGQALSSRKLK
jgi:EmrB/QacA subfamily drug resistance transporter